jgi:hypothetical protein
MLSATKTRKILNGSLDIRRYFYSPRVVDSWNSVPHDIKKSVSVIAFKNAYRRHRDAMFAPA